MIAAGAFETVFRCSDCGSARYTPATFCHACGSRRRLETVQRPVVRAELAGYEVDDGGAAGVQGTDEQAPAGVEKQSEDAPPIDRRALPKLQALAKVKLRKYKRILTGIEGFDRVLGEEEDPGPREDLAIILSGARGCGKSTILLQTAANISQQGYETVYGGGEGEGAERLRATADRVGLTREDLRGVHFLDLHGVPDSLSKIDYFLDRVEGVGAKAAIIDSMQGFARNPTVPKDVAEVARKAQRFSNDKKVLFFMVGHMNGDGEAAGGQLAQHYGDGVFLLEKFGDPKKKIVRCRCDGKNRGGWDTEEAFFKVSRKGICEYHPDDVDRDRDREAKQEQSRWQPSNLRSGRAAATSTTERRGRRPAAS